MQKKTSGKTTTKTDKKNPTEICSEKTRNKVATKVNSAEKNRPATDNKRAFEQTQVGDKKDENKNYHVSLREDGKWQVKFAKGERALKLFETQAEAISFAKKTAGNQDGSITIHKTDGKIRKQNYKK